jgi:hypothetical protein
MAKIKKEQEADADPSPQQRYSNRFDTMFKALMRLSSVTIVRFINALFGTNWPDTSVVSYPSTEFQNRKGKKQGLVRRIADCAIRISTEGEDHDYIMEIQVRRDTGLVVRIFEYSEEVKEMVEDVYLTRRQKEVLQERQKLEQESREFTRYLEEMGVSKEQIEQAWRKAHKPEPVSE